MKKIRIFSKKVLGVLFKYISYLQSRNKVILNSNVKINKFSTFSGKETFGQNVNFNGCTISGQGKVSFGDNFHSGKGLVILTSFHNYIGERIPYDSSVISKDVIIEDNVWVGLNVIILGGVIIGEGAIIQAGSVVSQNIPKLAIAGGNPARVFKRRNTEKYYKLKSLNQFL